MWNGRKESRAREDEKVWSEFEKKRDQIVSKSPVQTTDTPLTIM